MHTLLFQGEREPFSLPFVLLSLMASSFSLAKASLHLTLNISFLLLVLLYSTLHLYSSSHSLSQTSGSVVDVVDEGCDGLRLHATYEAKCAYLLFQTHHCTPEGYINYLRLFYCVFARTHPAFGYLGLLLWLLLLFYLLGNTTADYFCSSLAGLSRLLNLHPTVAGVTLLSLGNGAPDVFSSIVSFTGSTTSTTDSTAEGLVGLNSILGGAFFVSTVVIGIVSICVAPRKVSVDRSCFRRDVLFLLFVLLVLLAILFFGTVSVWSAAAFAGLYPAYVLLVSMTRIYGTQKDFVDVVDVSSVLPLKANSAELAAPLLTGAEKRDTIIRILRLLELPLYLPRRLTIPVVAEEKWSKPFAVVSVTLAPTLLIALWDSKEVEKVLDTKERVLVYTFGASVGMLLGISTALRTHRESPPTRLLFPWLAGGFLMSVSWTYIIAQELVSLLVSAGFILDISPSVLGLTVLAWGNSLGDLVANVAVAVGGGEGGAQVAVSGCYGGPIFNTLVGLGASLVLASWARYPASMDIPDDPTLFVTVGFLVAGLLWSLVVLPRRGMKPDRVLGVGLISIYLCFLCVRLGQSLGLI